MHQGLHPNTAQLLKWITTACICSVLGPELKKHMTCISRRRRGWQQHGYPISSFLSQIRAVCIAAAWCPDARDERLQARSMPWGLGESGKRAA